MKIVSLTPSATEIITSLDLLENLVGCSHECNFPEEVKEKLKVTSTKIQPNLSMATCFCRAGGQCVGLYLGCTGRGKIRMSIGGFSGVVHFSSLIRICTVTRE